MVYLRLGLRKYAHPVCLYVGAISNRGLRFLANLSVRHFGPLPLRLGRTVLELIPLKVGDDDKTRNHGSNERPFPRLPL